VERIRNRCPQVIAVPTALLIDPLPQSAEIWADARLAYIQKPFLTLLKSGVVTRSHMHRDYLSIIIPPFSNDLGTPGYGHPLYRSWYQLAAAHNTITVDGEQPYLVLPNHLEAVENGARAAVEGGWDGVITANRTLTIKDGKLNDRTEIQCEGEHTIDWFFHCEGKVQLSAKTEGSAFLGSEFGYEYFTDVRRISGDSLTLSFTLENRRLHLDLSIADMEAFIAKSPGNPANTLRTSIILRKKGTAAIFDITYSQELF